LRLLRFGGADEFELLDVPVRPLELGEEVEFR